MAKHKPIILTLDYIDNIKINADYLPNNIDALRYLREGMRLLASNVLSSEISVQKKYKSLVLLKSSKYEHFANFFNWFAINAISYCKLISLFKLMSDKKWEVSDLKEETNKKILKSESTKYIKKVIPEIHLWRNKVAAHPALVDPYPLDNTATLEFSIMANICYINNRFTIGALNWGSNGVESDLKPWSITKIFEDELIPRFWPQAEKIIKDGGKNGTPRN